MPGTQKLYCERKAKFLKDKGYWDFTALLEEVLRRKLFPPGVRYIFCDEAQDNSPLLWCVLRQWAETCERFTALGDPDQAIYDFLPADPTWFLKFIDSARRVELKQSYRLPRRVQAVSETWIKQNKERVDRAFYPRDADGQVKGRCHLSEFPWDEYAVPVPDEEEHKWVAFVLSRTRWQANQMKSWFLEKGIPFAVNRGTMNPLQTSKGRLVYAIVRLAEGEKVPAGDLKGVLRWVPAKPWMQHGGKTHFREFIEGNREQLLGFQDLMWNGFTPEYLDTLDSGDFLKPLKFTITEKAYLRRCYDRFGKFVFLNIPNILVTNIHGIKGMEAEYVILDPTLSSNPWQSMQNTPEEERRVGYTGITRASKGLFILEPNWASAGCYNFPLGAAL
jgi:superfamily I DNA/RNA helicase